MIKRVYVSQNVRQNQSSQPLNSKSTNIIQQTLSDGSSYIGQTLNGQWHGEGILCFGNKNRYKGDFKHGKFDGYGVFFGRI